MHIVSDEEQYSASRSIQRWHAALKWNDSDTEPIKPKREATARTITGAHSSPSSSNEHSLSRPLLLLPSPSQRLIELDKTPVFVTAGFSKSQFRRIKGTLAIESFEVSALLECADGRMYSAKR